MKTRRNKRSLNSRKRGEENSETIPFDLVIEILTRLPAKSIARFRSVSKLWESTVRSPYFTDSFFAISPSRPKILFMRGLTGDTLFFSSPQTQTSSSTLTADSHMSFPFTQPFEICRPVCGLVCGSVLRVLKGETVTLPLICNPSTGQSFTLSEVKTRHDERVINFLGYDPIDKQFKVLCISQFFGQIGAPTQFAKEHRVLTLGTGKKLSWRMIKCEILHSPQPVKRSHYAYDSICINGVLYYFSWVRGEKFYEIVCFDIRSEKFKWIRRAQGMKAKRKSILVKYKDKLATLQPKIVDGIYTSILWVLEDSDNYQWSRHFYVLPPSWNNIYEEKKLYFLGMISTGEIVLSSPRNVSDSFYLLYYNPERNTVTKVEIKGMEACKDRKVYTFLDHVEYVKLMTTV